jgi:ribosomal protein S18 acetylase RimI-like enzyme
MNIKLSPCNRRQRPQLPAILADLWNRSYVGAHGFFPLNGNVFEQAIWGNPRFREENLLLLEVSGVPAGFVHCDYLTGFNFPATGVVEALAVAPEFRRKGLGRTLLEAAVARLKRQGARVLDFGGSWPYTPFYSTLIDGSERSGIFANNLAALALCEKFGFRPEEKSFVMRLNPALVTKFTLPPGCYISRKERINRDSWLDFAFRRWRLFDHTLLNDRGEVLSRAIYTRMDGVSNLHGKELRAVFSVNTPERFRRQGWALLNLGIMINIMITEGVDELELHVYTDNTPAVNLYKSLGFQEIAQTTAMRQRV